MSIVKEQITAPSYQQQEITTPKSYSSPKLEKLGDLRSLTLGVSPGQFESGNEGVRREF